MNDRLAVHFQEANDQPEDTADHIGVESASLEDDHPLIGPELSLFMETGEEGRVYRMLVDQFTPNPQMHMVTNQLLKAGPTDQLDIRINSNGGSIDEGIRMFNIMDTRFKNRVTTTVDSKAYSMGAMLFCKGDTRIIHPLSQLMFHNYSTFMMGKAGEITDRMEHMNDMADRYFDDIIANGWLSRDELRRMLDGKDLWFDANDLLVRGIASHVNINGVLVSSQDYQRFLQNETLEEFGTETITQLRKIARSPEAET